jgi:RNA polymerase sigma factor (sigma-70 family)
VDDAFQATFLLLARSAGRLSRPGALAGWLHAAAVRIARDARRGEDRRRKREAARRTPAAAPDDLTWREVREVLDAEIAALPECDRLPVVLCCVQELSYEEAARRAGCPVGTLRNRLNRGKERLRRRLSRYGLPLAASVLILGQPPAVSAALARATLDAARTCFTRAAPAGGLAVSARLKAVLFASAAAVGIAFAASDRPAGEPPDQKPAVPAVAGTPPVSPPRTDPLGEPLPPGAVMRLGTRRFQVQTWPIAPVLLPGGKHYLTYHSGRNEFRWMDAGSGVVTDRWPVPAGRLAAGVSADGRWAVVAEPKYLTTGARVRPDPKTAPIRFDLHDLTARTLVKSFECQSDELEGFMVAAHGAKVSADGKWVATVNTGHGQTGRVRLWEVATGKVAWASEFPDISGPRYTPLGFTSELAELVLRESKGNRVHLVDTATGKARSFPTADHAQGEVLAPDGSVLVLGTSSPAVRVWDLKTGEERTPLGGHKEWARRFAFTPDGKTLVTAGNDPFLLVRDWPSGKVRKRIDLGRGAWRSYSCRTTGGSPTCCSGGRRRSRGTTWRRESGWTARPTPTGPRCWRWRSRPTGRS